MPRLKTIEATSVDVGTGKRRYGLSRRQVKQYLRISERTLTRYITLLVTHAPAEFDYKPYNNRWFNHSQIHSLRTLRQWFRTMTEQQIIQLLQEEGLPDDSQETA
jgi:hypothetical protein